MQTTPVPPLAHRSPSISVTLAAHFERLIATGGLPPGARLPSERDLAASMSVSRASLREAMAELENKHLIERTPGRGTIVVEASAEELELRGLAAGAAEQDDAAELRLVVEPSIAALAAQRATESNLLQLREVLDASTATLKPARSLELDLEFHLLLAHAAGNPLLVTLHGLMSEWTMPVRTHSHSTKAGRTHSVAWHRAIYDAVAAHNPEAARTAMENHLADVRHLIAAETSR